MQQNYPLLTYSVHWNKHKGKLALAPYIRPADCNAHEQTSTCRQLFADQVVGLSANEKEEKNSSNENSFFKSAPSLVLHCALGTILGTIYLMNLPVSD